jgi:hypothetical protein
VLVIEGPLGIGKSRLLTEVLALADQCGVRALFGEAFEYQQRCEGRIRNFVPNFGIEDRGDGGGVVGLVSKPEALEAQLKKYAAARV